MSNPSVRPTLIAVLVVGGLALSGCSSSGGKANTGPTGSSTTPGSSTTAASSTSSSKASAGSGPFCSRFTAAEVGAIVVATVTAGTDVAGRCSFTSSAVTATLFELPPTAAANGGLSGVKAGAAAGIKGTQREISGLGDDAFVESGTAAGSPLAEGAVEINGQVIEATIDNTSSTPAVLDGQLEALLRLASTRA